MTRDEAINKAKLLEFEYPLFKSQKNLSLTDNGFEFLKNNHKEFNVLQIPVWKPNYIIWIYEIMDEPYYLDHNKRCLYHYNNHLNNMSKIYQDKIEDLLQSFL